MLRNARQVSMVGYVEFSPQLRGSISMIHGNTLGFPSMWHALTFSNVSAKTILGLCILMGCGVSMRSVRFGIISRA